MSKTVMFHLKITFEIVLHPWHLRIFRSITVNGNFGRKC